MERAPSVFALGTMIRKKTSLNQPEIGYSGVFETGLYLLIPF